MKRRRHSGTRSGNLSFEINLPTSPLASFSKNRSTLPSSSATIPVLSHPTLPAPVAIQVQKVVLSLTGNRKQIAPFLSHGGNHFLHGPVEPDEHSP
jgi:hypothetical protein